MSELQRGATGQRRELIRDLLRNLLHYRYPIIEGDITRIEAFVDGAIETARSETALTNIPLDPTKEMIEAGAQRLVRWEEGSKWPDSWSSMDVRASRNDAERVWRSMWLAAEHDNRQPAAPASFELRGSYAESQDDKLLVVEADEMRAALLPLLQARQWFEGNPDGALGEIEHRVRKLLGLEAK